MKRIVFAVLAFAAFAIGIACLSAPSDGQQLSYPPVSLSAANTWTGLQTLTNVLQVTYNSGAGPAQSYPANTLQCANLGSGISYCDSVGIDGTHVGSWDFRQVSSSAGTFFDSLASDSSGNWTAHGNIIAAQGTNTVYRCTTAGTLPVGALTIATGNCGASSDTGLRVK